MPLERSPRVVVLNAVMETLLAAGLEVILADVLAKLGADKLTLRWLRNRYTTAEERPCIAIAFVSDEPRDASGQYLSLGEAERVLAIDIIADVELPTEFEAEGDEDTPAMVEDVARLEILSHFVDQALKALRQGFINPAEAPTPLTAVAHGLEDLGVDDDEDLADENGRLVLRANVLYRVRVDDPTVLLRTE